MRILITGGAGFVGSNLGFLFKRDSPDAEVVAFDNLRRRGSELTLARLRAHGITFVHGDIRSTTDLDEVGPFDLLIECSAEPSVQAGYGGNPSYVIDTNLNGTVNCLLAARKHGAGVVFLSSSRIYPIAGLRALPLQEGPSRLSIAEDARGTGWSAQGISENFPLHGSRSIYGTTKLCSELIIEEFGAMYGLRSVINRCGVLTGPWQMGKVDQGFVVLWAARHLYGGNLSYLGFGGRGLQVRDILHIEDLYDLVRLQIKGLTAHVGKIYNVGGGVPVSVSLMELTKICADMTRTAIEIRGIAETHPADIPYYVTDARVVQAATGWRPRKNVEMIVEDILSWLSANRATLQPILT